MTWHVGQSVYMYYLCLKSVRCFIFRVWRKIFLRQHATVQNPPGTPASLPKDLAPRLAWQDPRCPLYCNHQEPFALHWEPWSFHVVVTSATPVIVWACTVGDGVLVWCPGYRGHFYDVQHVQLNVVVVLEIESLDVLDLHRNYYSQTHCVDQSLFPILSTDGVDDVVASLGACDGDLDLA